MRSIQMASSRPSPWITLVQTQDEKSLIYDSSQLKFITRSISASPSEFPSLVVFIGNKIKTKAIRTIFSATGHATKFELISLFHHKPTGRKSHPILGANVNRDCEYVKDYKPHDFCQEAKNYRVHGSSKTAQQAFVDQTITALLFPLASVICVFIDDLGGPGQTATILSKWASIANTSTSFKAARPRVIIVNESLGFSRADVLQLCNSLRKLDSFSAVTVATVVSDHFDVQPWTSFFPLWRELKRELKFARIARIQTRTLFSINHFAVLFDRGIEHFVSDSRQPYSFIRASRGSSFVDGELPIHLGGFVELCIRHAIHKDVMLPFIASALLMNFFPPGMHCEIENLFSLILHLN